ncbi:trypco2 family protein [Streptomyces sp. NPDC050982]|uniref:trypco2 family protein n=1 Tax=Streptomyces sp. NPDC050982 TaxID=3154746 RepID=UPI0033C45904
MTEIPLARAISELRSELQQAMLAGAEEPLRFELETVDLELQVTMTAGGSAEAKVGLWSVLTAGTSADYSRGSVHKLTLKLSPRHADAPNGGKLLVGDRKLSTLPPAAKPED